MIFIITRLLILYFLLHLACYGEVEEVHYQRWSNMPGISTGSCLFKIKWTDHIPRFMSILPFERPVNDFAWLLAHFVVFTADLLRLSFRISSVPPDCLCGAPLETVLVGCKVSWFRHFHLPPWFVFATFFLSLTLLSLRSFQESLSTSSNLSKHHIWQVLSVLRNVWQMWDQKCRDHS